MSGESRMFVKYWRITVLLKSFGLNFSRASCTLVSWKKYKNIHGYNIKFRKNWLHPSICFTRFSRNEKIIWVCGEKCSTPIFSLITANQTLFNGRGLIEEFLSSDVITSIKPPLCLGIPELCNKIHCTCIFLVTIIFFFLNLIFRLVKFALNSQHVLHGQMATTQEFQASTPQERNSIICWLGVTRGYKG